MRFLWCLYQRKGALLRALTGVLFQFDSKLFKRSRRRLSEITVESFSTSLLCKRFQFASGGGNWLTHVHSSLLYPKGTHGRRSCRIISTETVSSDLPGAESATEASWCDA